MSNETNTIPHQQNLQQRVMAQAIERGWSQVGGDPLEFLIGCVEREQPPLDATVNWSEEREPRDLGDAGLLKAVWTFTGPYTGPCEGCDGECDEPCATSCTVEEAHAAIDEALKRHKDGQREADERRVQRTARMVERLQARIRELEQAAATAAGAPVAAHACAATVVPDHGNAAEAEQHGQQALTDRAVSDLLALADDYASAEHTRGAMGEGYADTARAARDRFKAGLLQAAGIDTAAKGAPATGEAS